MEPVLGRLRFAIVYFVAMLSGALGVLLLDPNQFTVGASGAVFGLMGAAVAAMRSRGINPFATGLGGTIVQPADHVQHPGHLDRRARGRPHRRLRRRLDPHRPPAVAPRDPRVPLAAVIAFGASSRAPASWWP